MQDMQMEPLRLELIEEGNLIDKVNTAIADVQRRLLLHVGEYGDKAKKAKAKVTLVLTLVAEDVDNGSYSIATEVKKVVPDAPVKVTIATSGEREGGSPCLFVRASGSTHDSPRQALLPLKEE